jgi:dihydrofolate reductase
LNTPKKIIIVAMTRDRVIGMGGKMPWHITDDLQLFKRLTFGQTLVMGRKTYESIGRPLPNRLNLVVSTTMGPRPNVEVCASFVDAITKAESIDRDTFFIGGAAVYQRALAVAGELRVSWVKADHAGDTFFPEFDRSLWETVSEQDYPDFIHTLYQRKR